jgi:hypothetical protein
MLIKKFLPSQVPHLSSVSGLASSLSPFDKSEGL